jgi:hypothetical protein
VHEDDEHRRSNSMSHREEVGADHRSLPCGRTDEQLGRPVPSCPHRSKLRGDEDCYRERHEGLIGVRVPAVQHGNCVPTHENRDDERAEHPHETDGMPQELAPLDPTQRERDRHQAPTNGSHGHLRGRERAQAASTNASSPRRSR